MKAALIVNTVTLDTGSNLSVITDMIHQAADSSADLVMLPEAALTGLIIRDSPQHDLPLGIEIPGDITESISFIAKTRNIWIAIGLIEREDVQLFDSAILINSDGEIALKYRRITPSWHGFNVDPSVYREGKDIPMVETPFGHVVLLICGDLFDDGLVEHVRDLNPHFLLVPFARCFDDGTINQERWDKEEMPCYAERAKLAGCTTLMVNYLAGDDLDDGGSFGGAMAVKGDGELIISQPLGKPGILFVDL